MSKQRIHKIYTRVYTKKAYDIFMRACCYASVAWLGDISRNFSLAFPEIEPDNEISWNIKLPPKIDNNMHSTEKFRIRLQSFYNSIYNKLGLSKTDEILYWLGKNIKNLVTRELTQELSNFESESEWHYKNNEVFIPFSGKFNNFHGNETAENLTGDITISDIVCLYDKLIGNELNIYSAEQLNNVIGIQRDPVETEHEIIYRSELDKINTEYNELKNTLNLEKKNFINNIELKYKTKLVQAEGEYNKKCQNLKKSLNIS